MIKITLVLTWMIKIELICIKVSIVSTDKTLLLNFSFNKKYVSLQNNQVIHYNWWGKNWTPWIWFLLEHPWLISVTAWLVAIVGFSVFDNVNPELLAKSSKINLFFEINEIIFAKSKASSVIEYAEEIFDVSLSMNCFSNFCLDNTRQYLGFCFLCEPR